jgi:hypothetical protein
MSTKLEAFDEPLALAATYLDQMYDASIYEACRAAAWVISNDPKYGGPNNTEYGWHYRQHIYNHAELAGQLNAMLPLWLAISANTTYRGAPA